LASRPVRASLLHSIELLGLGLVEVEALAARHDADDVALALVRLVVTERVQETGGRYTLGTAAEPG